MGQQDNTFTRLVRPTVLTATLLIFFILMVLDGNLGEFAIKPGYLSILETILTTMVIFYFSSRGIEKVATTFKEKEPKIGVKDSSQSFDFTTKDI